MRIFIISRGYPTPQFPQWGCFERDQAEALAAIGHEVVMISVDTRFRLAWRKIGLTGIEANGVHSLNFFWRPSVTYLGKYRRMWRERLQLRYVYQQAEKRYGKPDIIYSHYLFKNADAVWLGHIKGVPVAGIEHWSELAKNPIPRNVRKLGEKTYPYLDSVIAVSESLSKVIQSEFHQTKTHVVNNVLGNEFLSANTSQRQSDIVRLITTGSLIHRKGLDILITALYEIEKTTKNWQLDIIGEGQEKKQLQTLIQQLHLEHKIRFLGALTKKEIIHHYQNSDAFVTTSRSETFGVAIIEALAIGLPAIATICGGPEEFITEQNGILIQPEDISATTKALISLITNIRHYDRVAIAHDCKKKFSPEVIAHQLTQIFEETIQKYHKQA